MGNKPSLPAKEAIYHASKSGREIELETILRNVTPEARAADLLEWADDEGRTALVVAAAKGHVKVVDLLLRYQANVQHMSRRKNEGGTALHEAVFRQTNRHIVESLLRYGASPFVENIARFTALDYAIVRRDAGLIRRLEHYGYFSQYMRVRIRRNFGLSKSWAAKWVTVVPRHGCPLRHEDQQVVRRVLMIYNDARSYEPICKVYLDGANAREVVGNTGLPQALLTLHPQHTQPKGVNTARGSTGGWMLNFMGFEQGSDHLSNLIRVVNVHYEVPASQLGGGEAQSAGSVQYESVPPSLHERQGTLQSRQSYPAESLGRNLSGSNIYEEGDNEEDDISMLASAPPMPSMYPEASEEKVAKPPQFEVLGQDSVNLDDDENLCVICLSQPKTCGFVHGDSIHRCVCHDCAMTLQKKGDGTCPVCRQKIEHVITSFY
eukprot:g5666.t1